MLQININTSHRKCYEGNYQVVSDVQEAGNIG